jgi:hypothetical protein
VLQTLRRLEVSTWALANLYTAYGSLSVLVMIRVSKEITSCFDFDVCYLYSIYVII